MVRHNISTTILSNVYWLLQSHEKNRKFLFDVELPISKSIVSTHTYYYVCLCIGRYITCVENIIIENCKIHACRLRRNINNIYFADYAKRDIQRDANNNKTVDQVDVR